MEEENTETKPKRKGHLFKPGVSANPAGRPKDAFNKPNLLKLSRQMDIFPEEVLLHFVAGNYRELNLLSSKDITPAMRLKAAEIALKKMVPDLKAVEHNINTDDTSEKAVKTVVILPNNDRSKIELDDTLVITQGEVEEGMTEAISGALAIDV